MTIKEILDLDYTDVQRMTKTELEGVLRYATRYANRRIKTLKTHSNLTREALANFSELHGEFSFEGKTINQMREILTKERQVLGSKTSTVGGIRKVGADIAKRIGISQREYFSDNFDRRAFWKRYHEFMETYESAMYASRDVQRAIANVMREGVKKDDSLLDASVLEDDTIRQEVLDIEWRRFDSDSDEIW